MGNEDEVVIQSSPRAPDFSKKLMSSPGGQHGPATSFFEDLTSYGAGQDGRQPSAYPMAPSASAPVGVSNAWRPQSGSFSSTSSDASSFQSAVSESAQVSVRPSVTAYMLVADQQSSLSRSSSKLKS